MTHLAYIRIYLTPKNKKRIIWADTNKTFSYSDMSCSCFPPQLLGSLLSAAHLGVSPCKSLDAKLMYSQLASCLTTVAAWSIPRKFHYVFTQSVSSLNLVHYFPVSAGNFCFLVLICSRNPATFIIPERKRHKYILFRRNKSGGILCQFNKYEQQPLLIDL